MSFELIYSIGSKMGTETGRECRAWARLFGRGTEAALKAVVFDKYFTARRGLPHLAEKLRRGPVTIAYAGGSLTAMKEGWRPRVHAWFGTQFPAAQPHRSLHVGRGGVGSASGAFFIQDEVCGQEPDLVFIEYVINDSFDFLTPTELLIPSLEGMVRAVRTRHPQCDICFVYTTHILRLKEIEPVLAVHERVAEYYGIPSIRAGQFFSDLVASGLWAWQGEGGLPALLRDGCHPTPAGNEALANLIAHGVAAFLQNCQNPVPFPVAPLAPVSLERARVVPVTSAMISGPYMARRGIVGNCESEVKWFSLPAASRLTVEAEGSLVGLYVVVGPRSGVIQCAIGHRQIERNLFDRWCHYDRISTCMLVESARDIGSPPESVSVELSPAPPDYSVCPALQRPPAEKTLDVVALFVI